MSRQAFLFPGQGSQKIGMGLDLFENSSLAKERYLEANEIMGMDIAFLSFHGPEEALRQTEYTQPSIFIVSTILAQLMMEHSFLPVFTAGHSLGEYSALTTAGVFSFKDGLKLVRIRGISMQEAGISNPGTMAAIIGLDTEDVTNLCQQVSEDGIAKPANFNSRNQIVISGEIGAVKKVVKLAKEAGALKAMELNVSGAFHSPLMSPAKTIMEEALQTVNINKPEFPVIMNVSAHSTTDPDEIRQNLIDQLDHPVRWLETVEMLREMNVTKFIEVGPGHVLRGLNRRIDRSLETSGVESWEDIMEVAHA